MSNDPETQWLKTRMDRLRERREQLAPAFDRVWRAAEARRQIPAYAHRWLFASAAVALALAAAGSWNFARRQQHQRMERDFAAVEGALVTYWQAPSDMLFETSDWDEPAEP